MNAAVHSEPLLKLENIHKAFGPVRALQGVDLEVHLGEVHALIGENGAGKSTLMKILSGAYQPDEGRMIFDGKPYAPRTPLDGRAAGISMIYQELVLAPHLTVEENVTLGLERSRFGRLERDTGEVRRVLATLGQGDIDPSTVVRRLSIGKQQLVEIARALFARSRVVVMDEPTSSLSASDAEALFQVIGRLKEQGVSVIYISHFLEEVKEVCDTYTVIRDGTFVSRGEVAGVTIEQVIEEMVGRSVEEMYPESRHTIGETLVAVRGLAGEWQYPTNVSFELHRGEILGISGLVGAGRSETIRTLFGLEEAADGRLSIRGREELRVEYVTPRNALKLGMDLLSEDRKAEGLALNLPILANLTLSGLKRYTRFGIINGRSEEREGLRWIQALGIRHRDLGQTAAELSGGNQQKVCLARMLHQNSDVLFLDEPTRGIDVGSKAEIYRLIHRLAEQGKAIIMISSYLPEIFGICDTLAVMYKGVLSEVKPVRDWTETSVMHFATSGAA